MFLVEVKKNQITVTQKEAITSGSVNAYLVSFSFSEEWDDLNRVAVFKTTGDAIDVLLDETNQCFIPWEVMTKSNVKISFGVYGTMGDDVVLPTIWTTTDTILQGVVTGLEASAPTSNVISQLLEKIAELEKRIDNIKVDSGGTGGYSGEIYSAEETVIGKAMDGRPLYRKVISDTTGATSGTAKKVPHGISNLNQIISMRGTVTDSYSNVCSFPYYQDYSGTHQSVTVYADRDKQNFDVVVYNAYQGSLYNRPIIIVIEYTKTTDTASTMTVSEYSVNHTSAVTV